MGRLEGTERFAERRERGILGKANVVPHTVPLSVNVKSVRLALRDLLRTAGKSAPGELAQKVGSNKLRNL